MQMDTKIKGLSAEIVEKTFQQAKEARLHILGVMSNTISESRTDLSAYAPRVYKISVPTEKIGSVIGSGGNGQLLLQMFKQIGVDTAGIFQEPDRPTTKKM